MAYAKINDDGSVQFPYYDPQLERPNAEIPANVIEVDFITNQVKTAWDKIQSITGGSVVDNKYVIQYEIKDKYETPEAKLEGIKTYIRSTTNQVKNEFRFGVNQLSLDVVGEESLSWDIQRAEALAYSSDNTAATPLLTSIAAARGITVSELVAKVVSKVEAYNTSYGALLGSYQKSLDILASINVEDSTTWGNIDLVGA